MAAYGTTFILKDAKINGVFAPISGPGSPDSLSYYEVTTILHPCDYLYLIINLFIRYV
jgi:hypothetical protein